MIPLAPRIVNDLSCFLAPLHIIQRSSFTQEVSGGNADFIFVLAA